MPDTLFENFQPAALVAQYASKNNRQIGQVFLVGGTSHSITSVKVKVNAAILAATVGACTIDLYAVDGSNLPTGSSLMSGSINSPASISSSPTVDLIEITFGTPYTVLASTKYCWVITAENTSGGDALNVMGQENGSDGYTDGDKVFRDFSGSYGAWTAQNPRDLYFLNYGIAVAASIGAFAFF